MCASLHWGPRLQRGLDGLTGKHTEAQPGCVCIRVCDFIYTMREPRFLSLRGELVFLSVIPSCLRGFIYLKHAQPVVSGLAGIVYVYVCVCEWGFN